MIKIFLIWMALKGLFCPCHQEKSRSNFTAKASEYRLKKIGKMKPPIRESSGLAMGYGGSLLTISDGGGAAAVYKVNLKGDLLEALQVPSSSNLDWEEIVSDTLSGFVFIGDFGNNFNNRKELKIYRYAEKIAKTDTIEFTYPDQRYFPPHQKERNFDCEGMLLYKDSLYLFSKNRGTKMMHVYQLPAYPGKHVAKLVQKIYINAMITAAALSPDGESVALLSYDKVLFLQVCKGDHFQLEPYDCHGMVGTGQSEGLCYLDSETLLISAESGKLFKLSISVK